jgi:D-alanyl-D-alanine carboxypeptidase/D-alanyl-D-alanine-endopeptidase (penicillin-binding protein 4)
MKFLLLVCLALLAKPLSAQTVTRRLSSAIGALQKDEQFSHASLSMYVLDSKTGAVVFEKDPQLGLAPASTQKVITSVSAYELLGKDYTYKTNLGYQGTIASGKLSGNLYFIGSGDPTLGSWRWRQTGTDAVLQKIMGALKSKNISTITGDLIADNSRWETQSIPRGWIWEDVGNYYGAGAAGINWHENQYDLILRPGRKPGDDVDILKTEPALETSFLINELKTGKEGSGDNSIIYLPENTIGPTVRGTVPAGAGTYTVKGAVTDAPRLFLKMVDDHLKKNNIEINGKRKTNLDFFIRNEVLSYTPVLLATIVSPSLDSINSWFLQKSINLYGEAFVKTIAYEKKGFGATDSGLAIIRHFWSQRGIEKYALRIIDGSGLSPANRVTTHALVTVMLYAKKQSWFSSFYAALPEMNGIKMKDGYISGVRSYTGYIRSKQGQEYTFAFIVNNFDGDASTAREKMWSILNILK